MRTARIGKTILLLALGALGCPPNKPHREPHPEPGPVSTGSVALFFDPTVLRPGFTDLTLVTARVDLFYVQDGPAPPFHGDDVRCDSNNRTTVAFSIPTLNIPLRSTGREYVGGFYAPAGSVTEIRLILSSVQGTYQDAPATIRTEVGCEGRDRELQVVRLVPRDGVPFEIGAGASTRLVADFNALTDLTLLTQAAVDGGVHHDGDDRDGDDRDGDDRDGDDRDDGDDRNGDDRNGDDRNGDDRNGDDRDDHRGHRCGHGHRDAGERSATCQGHHGSEGCAQFILHSTLNAVPAKDIGRVGQLGGIFKLGAAASTLTFEFRVSPVPPTLPIVRSLGETPQQPTLTLPVTAMPGGYSVALSGSPPEGRLLIEIAYPGMGPEFHDADFALRAHVSDSPASRPSRGGRFQVFTRPEGASSALQLLIGSTELPINDLPPGVTRTSVVGVYSVDLLNESTPVTGWKLTLAGSGVTPALFFLPTGSTVWQTLSVAAIDGQPLLGADFAGAGCYLLGGN